MADHFTHFQNSNNYFLLPNQGKKIYKIWLPIYHNFPKVEKFGIGQKIDHLFLNLLEILRLGTYSPQNEKIILLRKSLKMIDSLRFFLQLSWEANLMSIKQFGIIGAEIEKLGKLVGSIKKNLEKKTSAETEERIK